MFSDFAVDDAGGERFGLEARNVGGVHSVKGLLGSAPDTPVAYGLRPKEVADRVIGHAVGRALTQLETEGILNATVHVDVPGQIGCTPRFDLTTRRVLRDIAARSGLAVTLGHVLEDLSPPPSRSCSRGTWSRAVASSSWTQGAARWTSPSSGCRKEATGSRSTPPRAQATGGTSTPRSSPGWLEAGSPICWRCPPMTSLSAGRTRRHSGTARRPRSTTCPRAASRPFRSAASPACPTSRSR